MHPPGCPSQTSTRRQLDSRCCLKRPSETLSSSETPEAPSLAVAELQVFKLRLEQERKLREAQEQRFARELRQTEARVKNHLAYRLGWEFIRAGRTPLRWLLLPWRLLRAHRAYRASLGGDAVAVPWLSK